MLESMDINDVPSEEQQQTVQVIFITELPETVPNTPFNVPLHLAKYGLSELVNHLLEQSPPKPYNFLVSDPSLKNDSNSNEMVSDEKILLTTTLAEYLDTYSISTEHLITLEYIEAVREPNNELCTLLPDWISDIDVVCSNSIGTQLILTGSYDAIPRIYLATNLPLLSQSKYYLRSTNATGIAKRRSSISLDSSNKSNIIPKIHQLSLKNETKCHSRPISCVKWLSLTDSIMSFKSSNININKIPEENSSTTLDDNNIVARFITGSKDSQLYIWKVVENDCNKYKYQSIVESECVGHNGSIESIATSNDLQSFVSSSSMDNNIQLWNLKENINNTEHLAKKKRLDNINNNINEKSSIYVHYPLQIFEGHRQKVSALTWPINTGLYSGSWDRSIRLWDPSVDGKMISNWEGKEPITCLDFSLSMNLLASGHHDSKIRLWDPRIKKNVIIKNTLSSHTSWISSISWIGNSRNNINLFSDDTNTNTSLGSWMTLLASASYDNTIKIWDIRASVPLHTINVHNDKIMTIQWGDSVLWSGGADCSLKSHIFL